MAGIMKVLKIGSSERVGKIYKVRNVSKNVVHEFVISNKKQSTTIVGLLEMTKSPMKKRFFSKKNFEGSKLSPT